MAGLSRQRRILTPWSYFAMRGQLGQWIHRDSIFVDILYIYQQERRSAGEHNEVNFTRE